MKKAIIYGVIAAFFFSFTFILNRSMNLAGGYWLWSASLRYLFTLPILTAIVVKQKGLYEILSEIKTNLFQWILWSTVGFGFFYLPLCMASEFGASWFVAATWQITIIAGVLLSPIFGQKLPVKNLLMSIIILVGVVLLQRSNTGIKTSEQLLMSFFLVLIAAVSYPLGNRKMMYLCGNHITAVQRVFGMTLCSLPFWIITAAIAFIQKGTPSMAQSLQSFIVAVCSGVFATLLFFKATHLVKSNPKQLAVVEATQSAEVLFTLLGGIVLLGDNLPGTIGLLGIILIIIGMIINSLLSSG